METEVSHMTEIGWMLTKAISFLLGWNHKSGASKWSVDKNEYTIFRTKLVYSVFLRVLGLLSLVAEGKEIIDGEAM